MISVLICLNILAVSWTVKSSYSEGSDFALLVIYKRVHQQTLINEFLPLWLFVGQVAIVVIGHDDAVWLIGQFDNETVIVAHNTASLNTARRGEDQDLILL